MPKSTLRANARTLPEPPTVAPSCGLSWRPAPASLQLRPALHARPPRPRARLRPSSRINQDLRDLAERLGELPREREQVVADLKSARDRFRETVPLPPKPRGKGAAEGMKNIFKIAHNPAPFGTTRPIEISVDFVSISGWRLLHRML